MKISIVIPVYNVEPYIGDCLKSVAAQTYKGEMECLIVDDCGQDQSIQIAKDFLLSYEGPIDFRMIHRKVNGGLSAARNSGIREATGTYVFFLDADDRIFPQTIESLVKVVQAHPHVDLVYGGTTVQYSAMKYGYYRVNPLQYKLYYEGKLEVLYAILFVLPAVAWNKLVRLSLILENELYFREGLIHEDEMWRWDIRNYIQSCAVCDEETYWYRQDNVNAITAAKDETKSLCSQLEIYKIEIQSADFSNPVEKSFLFSFLSPSMKIKKWRLANHKDRVRSKIKDLLQTASQIGMPWIIRHQISQWGWYDGLANHLFYAKWVYEYEKWCAEHLLNQPLKLYCSHVRNKTS